MSDAGLTFLTVDAGSSTIKLALYTVTDPALARPAPPRWSAVAAWSGSDATEVEITAPGAPPRHETLTARDHGATLRHVLPRLWSGPGAPLSGPTVIAAVGQRIVHGGPLARGPVVITPATRSAIAATADIAPLHTPVALASVDAVASLLPAARQVAVFDTSFHHALPLAAQVYPGPYAWYERGIRRYGFHGVNYAYCAARAAELLARPATELDLIVCHLGNGASLAAIHGGLSVMTTMGFTPLDGIVMGSRPGALDPGILLYLLRQGATVDELDRALNHDSGLRGIYGPSGDMRPIRAASERGDERARLAITIFIEHLAAGIASLRPTLERLDALVFTGGIGEHDAPTRAQACAKLGFLGLMVDATRNTARPPQDDIAAPGSATPILVIPANEGWALACACWELRDAPT